MFFPDRRGGANFNAEAQLSDSVELLSEAFSGLQGAVNSIKRRNSKVSDVQSELAILRRIRSSLQNDSSETSSSPAYSAMSPVVAAVVDSEHDVASTSEDESVSSVEPQQSSQGSASLSPEVPAVVSSPEFVPAPSSSSALNFSADSGFFADSSAYLFGEVPTDRPFFPGAADSLVGNSEFFGASGGSVPSVRFYVDPNSYVDPCVDLSSLL